MKFSKGDRVAFLNETGGGVILKYTSSIKVSVLNDHGFVVEYKEAELVKEANENLYNQHLNHTPKDNKPNKSQGITSKQRPEIVDLHIEALLDSTHGLSNRDMLRIQLSHFKQKMDKAIEKNAASITFIHGVGEGVLKFEITQILMQYENVTWQNASMKKYGKGATEVFFTNRNS